MKVVDIKGNELPSNIDIDECAVIDKMGFPHWGWLICWAILFWPACFVWAFIGMTRKHYHVYHNESVYILNELNYNVFKSTYKEEENV